MLRYALDKQLIPETRGIDSDFVTASLVLRAFKRWVMCDALRICDTSDSLSSGRKVAGCSSSYQISTLVATGGTSEVTPHRRGQRMKEMQIESRAERSWRTVTKASSTSFR
jgi:hypothetical protein